MERTPQNFRNINYLLTKQNNKNAIAGQLKLLPFLAELCYCGWKSQQQSSNSNMSKYHWVFLQIYYLLVTFMDPIIFNFNSKLFKDKTK